MNSEDSTVHMSEKSSEEIDTSKIDDSTSSQLVDQSVSEYIDKDGDMLPEELICDGFSHDEDEGDEDEDSGNDSDDEGWITPNNIHKIQQQSGEIMEKASVPVGCITTDFAMQVSFQLSLCRCTR